MVARITMKDRAAVNDWNEYRAAIISDAAVDPDESETGKRQRVKLLEAEPERWFKYYFPSYCTAEPAEFHKKATRRLLKNDRWYEVRAWSRELAKSARSMMEVLYLALTGKTRNVLLVSSSFDNAGRLLTPFKINLESNPRINNDYGKQPRFGSWEDSEFTTTGGVSFRAIGAGQSPRGTRNEAARPDFILVDDIDTDEECRNLDIIKKKWEWIEQALIPTVSISGKVRILFNGNVIANDCCVTRAMKMAKHVDVINIRDGNGRSAWPQKNSEEDVDFILSLISFASQQKEYFNNPVTTGDVFKETRWGKCPPLDRFKFLVAYGDPATSNKDKKGSSTKALVLVGFLDGKFYIVHARVDHCSNATFVGWYYDLMKLVANKTVVYYYIENNTLQDPFYEQVFVPLFLETGKTTGCYIGIIPDTRKKPDKFARIEGTLEPLNRLGQLVFNEAEKGEPGMQHLEQQFLAVSPRLPAPADGPDSVEGAVKVIQSKLSVMSATMVFGKRKPSKYRT